MTIFTMSSNLIHKHIYVYRAQHPTQENLYAGATSSTQKLPRKLNFEVNPSGVAYISVWRNTPAACTCRQEPYPRVQGGGGLHTTIYNP